jgi:hypothetical protein
MVGARRGSMTREGAEDWSFRLRDVSGTEAAALVLELSCCSLARGRIASGIEAED